MMDNIDTIIVHVCVVLAIALGATVVALGAFGLSQ